MKIYMGIKKGEQYIVKLWKPEGARVRHGDDGQTFTTFQKAKDKALTMERAMMIVTNETKDGSLSFEVSNDAQFIESKRNIEADHTDDDIYSLEGAIDVVEMLLQENYTPPDTHQE